MTTTKTQLLVRAALLLLAAQVAVTLYNGVRIRWMFWRMRSQGIVCFFLSFLYFLFLSFLLLFPDLLPEVPISGKLHVPFLSLTANAHCERLLGGESTRGYL